MAQSFTRTEVHGTVRKVNIKEFGSGRKVLEFTIPYNESYKDKTTGEWKNTPTEWFDMQIWGDDSNKWFQSAVRTIVEGAYIIITDAIRKTDSYENLKGEVGRKVRYKVNQFRVMKQEIENQPTSGGKASRDDAPF